MKRLLKKIMKPVAITVLMAFTIVASIPHNAVAYLPGSDDISKARAHDMASIKRNLQSKVVSSKLRSMGFTEAEINDRLSKLSDAEVHSFAVKSDKLSHGSGVVSVLILLALLALIGLTVLTSMGKRVVIR